MANSRCGLLFQILVVDLLRSPVLKSGVPTPRIVPEFDVPHNVPARMLTSRILGAVDTLVLKRGEERLRHSIIVAYPGAADGLPEVMYLQRLSELTGRVVAAAVRMENSTRSERIIAGSHLDSLLDQRSLVIVAHGPADHRLRVAVDNRREEKPALPRRNVGNIADHFLAGRVSSEIPVHQIGDVVLLAVALGEADPPRPRLAGLQAQLTFSDRTSSGPAGTPQATRSACTRRYTYVSSESPNDFFTYSASIPRLFAVADSGAFRQL